MKKDKALDKACKIAGIDVRLNEPAKLLLLGLAHEQQRDMAWSDVVNRAIDAQVDRKDVLKWLAVDLPGYPMNDKGETTVPYGPSTAMKIRGLSEEGRRSVLAVNAFKTWLSRRYEAGTFDVKVKADREKGDVKFVPNKPKALEENASPTSIDTLEGEVLDSKLVEAFKLISRFVEGTEAVEAFGKVKTFVEQKLSTTIII